MRTFRNNYDRNELFWMRLHPIVKRNFDLYTRKHYSGYTLELHEIITAHILKMNPGEIKYIEFSNYHQIK